MHWIQIEICMKKKSSLIILIYIWQFYWQIIKTNISCLCQCLCGSQEMTYRYFELGKNADPEREDSIPFKNAFTVHPISEPNLMYRLHKRFSQIELEWTYLQIQQLQVCNT